MKKRQRIPNARRVLSLLATGPILAVLAYVSYIVATWYRYGRTSHQATRCRDPLLDRFMPEYEVVEQHQIRVAAPAAATLALAKELDMQRSPLVRAIFAVRSLPARLGGTVDARQPRPLLEEMLDIGWGVLAEVPDREIVLGAVTKPWEPVVQFQARPPDEFAAFDDPGYAKIVWTLVAEPLGPAEALVRTETRVRTTDPASRERFRRYWAALSPGIKIIRYEILRQLKRETERRAQGGVTLSPHSVA